MSLKAMTLVWERSRAKGANLLTLLAIADHARDDGRHAWPSPGLLSARSRLTGRGAELILQKLVRDGEIAAEWSDADARLYFHIRCICEWPAYQQEGPSLLGEKISRKVKRTYAQKLCRLTAGYANGAAGYANGAAKSRRVPLLIRQDPSDPSVDLKAGASPRSLDQPPDAPAVNIGVITRLAHDVIDQIGPAHPDLTESVKSLCAQHRIAYDSGVVRGAIESAIWQRQHGRPA